MSHVSMFPFKCTGCGQVIKEGESFEYTEEDERVGAGCCGALSSPVTAERATIAHVLPRGRTKADACPRCFQIPSNSGICGCS